jgi:hypothetical protein
MERHSRSPLLVLLKVLLVGRESLLCQLSRRLIQAFGEVVEALIHLGRDLEWALRLMLSLLPSCSFVSVV